MCKDGFNFFLIFEIFCVLLKSYLFTKSKDPSSNVFLKSYLFTKSKNPSSNLL
jgi:hypothetical protein